MNYLILFALITSVFSAWKDGTELDSISKKLSFGFSVIAICISLIPLMFLIKDIYLNPIGHLEMYYKITIDSLKNINRTENYNINKRRVFNLRQDLVLKDILLENKPKLNNSLYSTFNKLCSTTYCGFEGNISNTTSQDYIINSNLPKKCDVDQLKEYCEVLPDINEKINVLINSDDIILINSHLSKIKVLSDITKYYGKSLFDLIITKMVIMHVEVIQKTKKDSREDYKNIINDVIWGDKDYTSIIDNIDTCSIVNIPDLVNSTKIFCERSISKMNNNVINLNNNHRDLCFFILLSGYVYISRDSKDKTIYFKDNIYIKQPNKILPPLSIRCDSILFAKDLFDDLDNSFTDINNSKYMSNSNIVYDKGYIKHTVEPLDFVTNCFIKKYKQNGDSKNVLLSYIPSLNYKKTLLIDINKNIYFYEPQDKREKYLLGMLHENQIISCFVQTKQYKISQSTILNRVINITSKILNRFNINRIEKENDIVEYKTKLSKIITQNEKFKNAA